MRARALVLALGLIPTSALAQAADDPATRAEAEPEVGEPIREPPPPHPSEPPSASRSRPPIAARTAGAPATPQPPVVVHTTHSLRREAEDEDEEEDETDHFDVLIIELFGGVSYVDLRAVNHDNYYPEFVRLQGTGPVGGLALGFRIEFFGVGVRGSVAHYADDFDVGTVALEVTLSLPIPVVKPYLRAGFGLAWHGDANFTAPTMSQTTVFGFVFNAAVGLDIYLADWFALGAALSVDVLNMNRQTIDGVGPADAGMVEFTETGDAVGLQIRGQGAASFHF